MNNNVTIWVIGSVIAVVLIVVIIEYLFTKSQKETECKELKNKVNKIEADTKKEIRDINSKLERIYNLVKK